MGSSPFGLESAERSVPGVEPSPQAAERQRPGLVSPENSGRSGPAEAVRPAAQEPSHKSGFGLVADRMFCALES